MHIDHILVQAPNAQLSAGEVTYELIEGSESVVAEGLENGLIAVADALPEHLMQPFTSDRLEFLFHPGAKLDVTIYPDEKAAQSQGHDLCDNLGEHIARARITLGDDTFADEHMINLDPVAARLQTPTGPKNCMPGHFPEAQDQDHPLFRGCAPRGTTNRHSLTAGPTQSWRAVWDRALAGRQFANIDSNPASDDSAILDTESETTSDIENDDDSQVPNIFEAFNYGVIASESRYIAAFRSSHNSTLH
jgi:hypothetical protein